MIRSLRAFVWLRWRLVLNSVRGGRRRDTFEQISRALALAVPFILVALAFGSVVAMAIVGFWGGNAVATGLVSMNVVLAIARGVLFGLLLVIIIFAVTSPVQGSLTHYTRLLLLPISRRVLHLVEVLSSLADPWIAFLAPGLLLFAVGVSFGGRTIAAIWAAVAASLFLVVLAALAALVGFLVAWLVRDRRRSELFTLVFVLILSVAGFLPLMLAEQSSSERREARRRGEARQDRTFEEIDRMLPVWTRALPSELYGRTVRAALEDRPGAAGAAAGALMAEAILLFAASSVVHRRLIGSTSVNSRRRQAEGPVAPVWRIPGQSSSVSAVAIAQARTALRSVRGRLVVFLSGPILAVLVFFFRRFEDGSFITRLGDSGFILMAAGALMAILSAQAFTMNLFASDRAGLTLQFLLPISDAELARAKILGVGLLVVAATALAAVAAFVVAPGGAPALWVAAFFGVLAIYLLLSPVAVWLSAMFPVAADLSKTGSGGNPHGFAAIVGMAGFAAATALTGGVFAATIWGFERPDLALPVMTGWLVIAAAVAHPLVVLASRAISLRRENLGLVAQGR